MLHTRSVRILENVGCCVLPAHIHSLPPAQSTFSLFSFSSKERITCELIFSRRQPRLSRPTILRVEKSKESIFSIQSRNFVRLFLAPSCRVARPMPAKFAMLKFRVLWKLFEGRDRPRKPPVPAFLVVAGCPRRHCTPESHDSRVV